MIDHSLAAYLLSGILLGAGAGITPGPLNALIISESIKNGRKAGIKIALAPLLTDAPIVTISLLLVIELSKLNSLLAIIAMLGGTYIIFLGVKDVKITSLNFSGTHKLNGSFKKGIVTNFLTPHPYVFWITIGSPIVFEASRYSTAFPIAFVLGFYALLVGFKIFLALFTVKMKRFIQQSYYLKIIRSLGFALILFGIYLFYDGLNKLFLS